jgi:hypothetical protein
MVAINTALPIYIGYGELSFPQEDGKRLIAVFGPGEARALEPQIRTLLTELDGIKPDWNVHTLESGSEWAVSKLRQSHPEIDDHAAAALKWIFSWWWK